MSLATLKKKTASKYRNNIFRNIDYIQTVNGSKISEKRYEYDHIDINHNDNVILEGYFQSYKYFSHPDAIQTVRDIFQVPRHIKKKVANYLNQFRVQGNGKGITNIWMDPLC